MDWETRDIDFSRIDVSNHTYRITSDQTIEPLAASIGALGLLNPPFLIPADGRQHMVVAGFKRVAACRQLGHAGLRARVLRKDVHRERLAEIAVCDNSSQRSLNLVELSRSLNLLTRQVENPSTLEQVCQRLGLPDHASMQGKIMRICRMPAVVQEGILEGAISLNTALMLEKAGGEGGALLANMFLKLRLSHSKQREILTNIDDITHRDGVSVKTLLNDRRLHALIADPETNRTQKAAKVRQHFRSRRFPQLTLAEHNFQSISKKLPLGDNLRIQAPAGFESSEYLFTIAVKEPADLERGLKTLQQTLDDPCLKHILALKKR